jgi:hypothetical protein
MSLKVSRHEIMLFTQTKNHCSYPVLDNVINSLRHSNSNNGNSRQLQHYLSESSSSSLINPNYIQNQGSKLDTIIETRIKVLPKSPFIKRILVVDDDSDFTLTFKAGLEGYHYDGKKRFEAYTYNDALLVVKEFKP